MTEHSRIVHDSDVPWAEVLPGIEIRMLRVERSGRYAMMLRCQPGTALPTHRHLAEVHAFTLQGLWRYDEYPWVAGPWSYVHEPAGATHTLSVPADQDGPTVIAFVVEGPQIMLDEHGGEISTEGAHTLDEYYRLALEGVGIGYPTAVITN